MRTSEAETGGSEGLCDCSPIHPSDTATSHLLHGQVIIVSKPLVIIPLSLYDVKKNYTDRLSLRQIYTNISYEIYFFSYL